MNDEALLATHTQKIVGLEHRVKDLEELIKIQNDLIISVNRLASNMENMLQVQKEQGASIKKLESEPIERWNSTKKTFFTAVTSAIATAFAGGIIWLFVYVAQHGGI